MAESENINEDGKFVNPTLEDLHEEMCKEIREGIEEGAAPSMIVFGYTKAADGSGMVECALVPVPNQAMDDHWILTTVLTKVAREHDWFALSFCAPAHTLEAPIENDGTPERAAQVAAALDAIEKTIDEEYGGDMTKHPDCTESVIVITVNTEQFIRSRAKLTNEGQDDVDLSEWDTMSSTEEGVEHDALSDAFMGILRDSLLPEDEGDDPWSRLLDDSGEWPRFS